jgi:signal transduction histidine kinase
MESDSLDSYTHRPPPWSELRSRLLDRAAELADAGDASGAAVLRALVETWWRDQTGWNNAVHDLLRVNHEINNALVGVSGNTQLLLTGEAGRQPKLRERLLVVLRESERIERAVNRLQVLKAFFDPPLNPLSHELDAENAA